MVKYLYFQSLVQYRIPLNEDGTTGNPEITRKFTSEMKGTQDYSVGKQKAKAKVQQELIKTEEKQQALDKLSTSWGEVEEL
jgi:hypothetical protein